MRFFGAFLVIVAMAMGMSGCAAPTSGSVSETYKPTKWVEEPFAKVVASENLSERVRVEVWVECRPGDTMIATYSRQMGRPIPTHVFLVHRDKTRQGIPRLVHDPKSGQAFLVQAYRLTINKKEVDYFEP